ncbi:putative ribonuclease H-like domain-containing protein [Tanacetum coccineum]
MSIDDLYNNFKIVEQSVKKSVGASSSAQNLAFMTALSTSSTNDVNTAKPAYEVSTVSPNVNTASPQDLEKIHEDDLEAMDLKWYDKSKVECFNCHKMGYFSRECRVPRNKDGQFINQDNTRKHGNNKDTSSKEMLAIDGVGFDWSDMTEEHVQTNMALMTFLDSKNEVLFSEEVTVLKREVACKDYEINVLKSEFEKVKQEKEGIEFKIEKFDNASKSLNMLLESQITEKMHEFKSYGSEHSKKESNNVCDKKSDASKENSDDSLVKGQVSEDTSSFVKSSPNVDKETVFLDKKIEFFKHKNHEKPVKKSIRLIVNIIKGKGWNMVPRAVLMKTGLKPFDTARTVNTAHPKSTGKPLIDDKGFVDNGCSRHMTGNIAYLSNFKNLMEIVSTLDTTHVEFFSDEDELEVDLRNITNSYTVPTTPNTRIHKDHPIKNVIGDVKSSIQTRRMTKSTSEQGFLSAIKPISIAKALSDSSWVEAMDVKSSFLYEILCEDVLCNRPPGFKDPDNPDKVYKVVKALYGLHQVPKAWYETLANYMLGNGFKRGKIDQTLFIKKQKGDILLVHVYVDDIIFGSTNKELFDLENPLVKDRDANDVDVHLYRSMIGSLMYLTSSRPDIIYLKGKPTLGLLYSRDSPFKLVAYTDSDYVGATQDRKSTTGCCQFLGNRLISWQCKKQTVVATSTTEAEYVAVASYLLTKGFDAGRFQYLVSSIGILNP